MSDIASIASGAVAAYQRALGTVSNNIANASTPGYARQVSTLEANPIAKVGNLFMGTGVNVTAISRAYDSFVEANYRNSNSDLLSQEPMVNYTNRIVDVMGSDSMGLSSALDQFFNSARMLSTDPASTALRGSFMADATSVSSRFSEISGQLDLVQNETTQAVNGYVDQINTITSALAQVNNQLTKQKSLAAQPADLLDQRDTLLKNLSDFAHVNAKYAENGVVTVSLGPSFVRDVVVDAGTAFNIGTNYNSASPEKVSLVLDPYGKNQPLTAVTSGKLAGMLSFREQVLGSSRDALDTLAHSFVNEVNKIQTSGVDAYGNNGTDLFKFDPKASNAAGGIQLAFDDPMRLAAASQFRIAESATNTGGAQSKITYTPPNFAGPPSVQQGIGNDPRAAVTFTATPGHPYSAVATLPNGLQNINVMMNGAAGQNLQVFTRDGRQIVGTALTSDQLSALVTTDNGFSPGATVSTQYLNQSGANGYKDLSVFYGARADVRMQQQWDMNVPDPTAHPELPPTPLPALLQGGRIPAGLTGTVVANQALTLNGQSLGPLVVAQGQTLQASDISAWINNANVNGVHAMATNHLQITPSQFATGKPLVLNGQSITSGVNSLVDLAAAINGNSACRLAATIDADGNLQITNSKGHEGESIVVSGAIPNALGLANDTYTGSVSIVRAPQLKFTPNQVSASNAITLNGQLIQASSNSVSSLAAAINASSALTNLKAKIDSDGNLLIENAIGHEGEDIQVSGATPNALGLTNGRVSMTANLLDGTDHSIQLGFTSTGKPDDLSKLGLATDAFIQGQANEDLLVFVTGAGTSQISATYTGAPTDAKQALRASPLQIRFDNADHYSIWDTRTNTQVASQAFDAGQLDPGITYQGLQVSFTAPPKAGDVFTMDGNRDGTGNNQNMLDLVDLQKAKVMGGGRTLSEAYVDQVNDMGNVARQATIAQSALKVVNDQAISARDQVSGVSMDQEAADLIRFQQAYQASAKVLQVASEVFDSILQVR